MVEDDQPETLRELEVIEPGYGPLFRDLQESLGEMSLNSVNIEAAMSEAEIGKANYKLLTEFAKMLPKSDGRSFDLEGNDAQYMIRQIQANVVDVNGRPHFIVGRHNLADEEVELLLLKADGVEDDGWSWSVTALPIRKDALAARDRYVQSFENKELTEGEIESIRQHGRMVARGASSISLSDDKNLKPPESGYEHHIHYQRWRASGYDERTPLIPAEVIDKFEVNTYIAKLAIAFKVEDKLRAYLGETKQRQALSGQALTDALESQNKDLKSSLKNMLIAGGLSEADAEEMIRQRYPDYR